MSETGGGAQQLNQKVVCCSTIKYFIYLLFLTISKNETPFFKQFIPKQFNYDKSNKLYNSSTPIVTSNTMPTWI